MSGVEGVWAMEIKKVEREREKGNVLITTLEDLGLRSLTH